jgi:hypothetical protein
MSAPLDLDELGQRAAAYALLAEAYAALARGAKNTYVDTLLGMKIKTYSADVEGANGAKYASIVLRKGSETISVAVTDPAALHEWVDTNLPEQIIEVVNPAWLERVINVAKKTGKTACADTDGDELPGVTVTKRTGDPGIAITLADDAKAAARELVAAGEVRLPELPAPAADGNVVDQGAAEPE